MLDTLMVLLTKKVGIRLLRAFFVFLLACMGIGVLLALVIISGVPWPGVVATASSVPNVSHGPVLAPSPMDASIPIILQNPCAVTPTPTSSSDATVPSRAPAPAYGSTPAPTPTESSNGSILPQTPLLPNILDPLLSTFHSKGLSSNSLAENCLSNRLATSSYKDALARLASLTWPLLVTAGLLLACGLSLLVLGTRRKHQKS